MKINYANADNIMLQDQIVGFNVSIMTINGTAETDVKNSPNQARKLFDQLQSMWTLRIFNRCMKSTLLCKSEI